MGLGKIQCDLVGPSGGKQDRHLGKDGAKAGQGAAPTQPRHVHIEDHHIGHESGFNPRQRFFTIWRCDDGMAQGLKDGFHGTLDHFIIVDQKHVQRPLGHLGSSPRN